MTEKYVNGKASVKELRAARNAVWVSGAERIATKVTARNAVWLAARAAWNVAWEGEWVIAGIGAKSTARAAWNEAGAGTLSTTRNKQADILRDTIGNPFRKK